MKVVTGQQPVYLPWLGLIHKASLADVFVFMDDVRFTTGKWDNRNRIKTAQGGKAWLTVPLDLKNSASAMHKDILIFREGKDWQESHWLTLKRSYGGTHHFREYAPFFEWLYLERRWERLADLNLAILKQAFLWFGLKCEIVVASEEPFAGRNAELVLEHGTRFGAEVVIADAEGREFMDARTFEEQGVALVFQNYIHLVYSQRFGEFMPYLSFVDLLFQHGQAGRAICLRGNLTREDLPGTGRGSQPHQGRP